MNKADRKEEISGIVLSNILQEKLRNIDVKSCRVLIEVITILRAMKQKSIVDLEALIARERPEILQGLAADGRGASLEPQVKKI